MLLRTLLPRLAAVCLVTTNFVSRWRHFTITNQLNSFKKLFWPVILPQHPLTPHRKLFTHLVKSQTISMHFIVCLTNDRKGVKRFSSVHVCVSIGWKYRCELVCLLLWWTLRQSHCSWASLIAVSLKCGELNTLLSMAPLNLCLSQLIC
jgi:hypothetical protein